MLNIEDIQKYLETKDLDIRKTRNGRWIDQKCTPDIIWSISDFVLNYEETFKTSFSVKDIWQSEYAKETIYDTYSKPGTDEKTAENEYDKVFSQPLNLLCYAGILEDVSPTKRHIYVIKEKEILEYIGADDLHSLRFLCIYIKEVLIKSDLYHSFECFFLKQTKESFISLKKYFISYYLKYTPINGTTEISRIFSKVLNPLSYHEHKRGTERGRLSSKMISKSDLMYNRDNFRDLYIDKPKNITRKKWISNIPDFEINKGYLRQQMNHAIRVIKAFMPRYRGDLSELTQFIDGHDDKNKASQIHHIFPKNEFPNIMHYLENLIALTPNQHYQFAHPNNNTQIVDQDAQKILLIAKIKSIEKNLNDPSEEKIYNFQKFLKVLAEGWGDNSVLEIEDNDFIDIMQAISAHYY